MQQQFDDFTGTIGSGFLDLLYSVGANIICPVGAAICIVLCILAIIKAFSVYNLDNGRSGEFWRICFAAAVCLFGAVVLGSLWAMFSSFFK